MNRFFRLFGLLAAITGVVWVAVLWNWETTRRSPTIDDIALYLALLPLTVFGVVLGLRWAWQGAGGRREAAIAAAAAAADSTVARSMPAAGAATPGEAQRHATVQVLSAHVASHAGISPAEVLTAVAGNERRPGLDPELRDADGLAVMSARIADLPIEALLEELAPTLDTLHARRPEWAAASPEEHVLRALAILAEPLAGALHSLRPWAVRLGATDRQAARPPLAAADTTAAMVRVLLGWPSDWADFERDLATEWVTRRLPIHAEVPVDRFVVLALPVASGEELWLRVDQLLQTLASEARSDLVLVAAGHSDLSDAAIAPLEQQNRLFSPRRHPKGLMPGEAAAALVLAPTDWPADPDAARPAARLHRAALMRRDKSVEAPGRISSQCLQDCLGQALSAARIEAAAMPALVCDADQHTPRGAELFGATLALLPHLDPSDDMRLVGVATGHIGIASTLLTIATASEQAQVEESPCLALCVGDAFMRLALVARPAATSTSPDAVST